MNFYTQSVFQSYSICIYLQNCFVRISRHYSEYLVVIESVYFGFWPISTYKFPMLICLRLFTAQFHKNHSSLITIPSREIFNCSYALLNEMFNCIHIVIQIECTHILSDKTSTCIIQICSGITHGRVLNGELYAQRLQKLIYLCLTNADELTSVISV